MRVMDDPFGAIQSAEVETALEARAPRDTVRSLVNGAATVRLHGFNLDDDRPLLAGLPELPGEIVVARTVVPLTQAQIGCSVLVVFDRGEARRPIVIGVLQDPSETAAKAVSDRAATTVAIDADGERLLVTAEREIVLRCGEASLTLTRAGKVLIKGNYILSRSTGHNRIKGAAVDIN